MFRQKLSTEFYAMALYAVATRSRIVTLVPYIFLAEFSIKSIVNITKQRSVNDLEGYTSSNDVLQ